MRTADAFDLLRRMVAYRNPKAEIIRGNQITADGSPVPFPKEKPVVVVITPQGFVPHGWPDNFKTDAENGNITETLSGHVTFRISIDFYCKAMGLAQDLASEFGTWLKGSNAKTTLDISGAGFVRVSSVRDLTSLVNASFESRANLDLEISAVTNEMDELLIIEKFTVGGSFIPDNRIPIAININN